MGAGGRMSDPPSGKKTAAEALRRAPHEKPPFTVADLKKAIPPHCFQKSLITSFRYLIQDLIMAYTIYYVATNYIDLLPRPLNYLGWAAYIAVQGCVLTGAWVIGHECDHHAFSDYQWVDDLVGLVVHSSLLVPYFSWKISHRRHHANTQSLENDEVYVPRFKSNIRNYYKIFDNPPGRVLIWITTLLIGFPLYLMFNVSGHKYERWTSHYDPHSPLYSDRERKEIIISDVAILAVIYGLYRLVLAKGFAWVFCVYGGPLLVVNGWFVLITILNHTHPSLPYYDSNGQPLGSCTCTFHSHFHLCQGLECSQFGEILDTCIRPSRILGPLSDRYGISATLYRVINHWNFKAWEIGGTEHQAVCYTPSPTSRVLAII